jgi:hypothetical protein
VWFICQAVEYLNHHCNLTPFINSTFPRIPIEVSFIYLLFSGATFHRLLKFLFRSHLVFISMSGFFIFITIIYNDKPMLLYMLLTVNICRLSMFCRSPLILQKLIISKSNDFQKVTFKSNFSKKTLQPHSWAITFLGVHPIDLIYPTLKSMFVCIQQLY